MLPGRTHPTPAGRNEGANRASVIGRSRQVGCDTPVGSRLPVAVLRPQSPLSAPDAEANHTGNIGSKTVRRRLGDLPVKYRLHRCKPVSENFAVQICSPDAGLAAQSRTYVSAIPVKQAAEPQTIVRTSVRRRNIFIYVSHAAEACRAYAPVGDVYGASELFCEADAAVHENGAPKADSGDEGDGRHTR